VQSIDHTRIVDVKVKRVLGVARVMRMATQSLSHRNDFSHVFNDRFACAHVTQSEHAFAVHAGGQDFDARVTQPWQTNFVLTIIRSHTRYGFLLQAFWDISVINDLDPY
jgi:hypothetical protein